MPILAVGAIASLALGFCQTARAENPAEVQRLLRTGYCPACDLSGADLSGVNLGRADLSGAILIGANLSNAYLRYANLSNAILNAANLSGADFRFANLRNASLQGARIEEPAVFTGANLDDTVMSDGRICQLSTSPTP